MEFIIIAVLVFGGTAVAAWAKDLVGSGRDLAHPHGEEAMQAVERAFAAAEVVALAALADGEVTAEEWEVIRQLAGAEGSQMEDVTAAVQHLQAMRVPLESRAELQAAVEQRARKLDDPFRALAYRHVVDLCSGGSRLQTAFGGYRDMSAHPQELLDLFAEGLGMTPEARREIERDAGWSGAAG